jgi:hypothetical protein
MFPYLPIVEKIEKIWYLNSNDKREKEPDRPLQMASDAHDGECRGQSIQSAVTITVSSVVRAGKLLIGEEQCRFDCLLEIYRTMRPRLS